MLLYCGGVGLLTQYVVCCYNIIREKKGYVV